MSSAVASARLREIATMIARPTTPSAAATTSTKKTTTCPPMSFSMRAKVTKVKLTALSISSTHMNMTSTLRRISNPTAPMVKSMAARPRYQAPGTLTGASLLFRPVHAAARRVAGEHDRPDHGDDQQDRGHLEGQQVAGEQGARQLLDVAPRPVG